MEQTLATLLPDGALVQIVTESATESATETPTETSTQGEKKEEKEETAPDANPLAPRLRNRQLEVTPSLERLREMTEEQLRRVEHASIACAGIGRVEWEEPVDLRGLDLDALVSFEVEDGYPTVAVGVRSGGER